MSASSYKVRDSVVWSDSAPAELIKQFGPGPFIVATKLGPGTHRGGPPVRVILCVSLEGDLVRDERGVIKPFDAEWFRKAK